jgi:hypothetical protein
VPWLLLNPTDDPAILAALHSDEARTRRILLIRLSPSSTTVTHLVYDTLRALGVDSEDINNQLVDHDQLPRLLTYRLCGLRLAVIAVDCPHLVNAVQLGCLQRWCDHLRAQLVLVTPDDEGYSGPKLGTSLQLVLHSASLPTTPERVDAHEWPLDLDGITLPGDEFTTFRTSCLQLLPKNATTIDALYTDAFRRAQWELDGQPPHTHLARAEAAVFHALTLHDPPAVIRLILLRATQAALFTHYRILLRWEPVTPPHLPHTSLPGSLAPQQHADLLSRVLRPDIAVDNLLFGLFELSWGQLRKLRRDQIVLEDTYRPDLGVIPGPALVSGTHVLRFPEWTRPTLDAYRCARDHHSNPRVTPDSELYLVGERPILPLLGLARDTIYRPVGGSQKDARDTHFNAASDTSILHTWLTRRHLRLIPLPEQTSARTDSIPQPER